MRAEETPVTKVSFPKPGGWRSQPCCPNSFAFFANECGGARPYKIKTYADWWVGDFVNKISNTSNPAPTTIALSATLKAGHWCGPI